MTDSSPERSATRLSSTPGADSGHDWLFLPNELVAGRFVVRRFLGRGGMGQVFSAWDSTLRQDVALKVVRPERSGDRHVLSRFRQEALLARRVTHPNVCRVFDVFEHRTGGGSRRARSTMVLVMELLDGLTLDQTLRRRGPLPAREAMHIARELAAALDAAHRARVIHLDFKSANVLLATDGSDGRPRAVITDFGLARVHGAAGRSARSAGTPGYIAPEILQGDQPGPSADLYSFGVVLHEMVTGRRPQASPKPRLSKELPASWDPVLRRCLAQRPRRRFRTAGDIVAALGGPPVPAVAPVPRRRAYPAVAAALALLILLSLGSSFGNPSGPAAGVGREASGNPAGEASPGERSSALKAPAESPFRRYLTLSRFLGGPDSRAMFLNELAMAHSHRGDSEGSRRLWGEMLRLARRSGLLLEEIVPISNLAILDFNQGRVEPATQQLRGALRLWRHIDNHPAITLVLARLADMEALRGNFDAEQALLGEAEAYTRRLDSVVGRGVLHQYRARTALREGRYENAGHHARRATEIFRQAGPAQYLRSSRCFFAESLAGQGRFHQAAALLLEADAEALDYRMRLACARAEARLHLGSGEPGQGIRVISEALEELPPDSFTVQRLRSELWLGRVELEAGEDVQGRSRLLALARRAEELGAMGLRDAAIRLLRNS